MDALEPRIDEWRARIHEIMVNQRRLAIEKAIALDQPAVSMALHPTVREITVSTFYYLFVKLRYSTAESGRRTLVEIDRLDWAANFLR